MAVPLKIAIDAQISRDSMGGVATVTMALIHALERCTAEERETIETVLHERAFRNISLEQVLRVVNKYGSVEAANSAAAQYSEAARNAICPFPDSEFKRALLWVPDFVIEREK